MSKFIEVHCIRTLPYNNVNRGEDGSPKSCIFGGVQRGRISSQSLKRAVREGLMRRDATIFAGVRTRHVSERISEALKAREVSNDEALKISEAVGDLLGKNSEGKEGCTKNVLYVSPGEVEAIADDLVKATDKKGSSSILKKVKSGYEVNRGAISKILKNAKVSDAVDIGINGRMVASDPTLTVDGALSVAHAISVHKVTSDIDFFSALDEDSSEGETGAGHTNELLYNTATYYMYYTLDLNDLRRNLPNLNEEEIKKVIDMWLRESVRALPEGKKNAAFAHTLPGRALAIVRDKSTPIILSDAFEDAIHSTNGYKVPAWERLTKMWESAKSRYGSELGEIKAEVVFSVEDGIGTGIDDFCKGVTDAIV